MPDAPEPVLTELVTQLRAERDGLRRAMRTRAVIEQAKGILMARLGIGPDEAFDELARMSQRTNIRLAEVAASLVGRVAPEPAATGGADDAAEPAAADEGSGGVAGARDPARAGEPAAFRGAAARRSTGSVGGRDSRWDREADPSGDTAGPAADRPGAAGGRTPEQPRTEADWLQVQHQLLAARIDAADDYSDIVAAVAESHMGWPAPHTIVLALAEPDGALRQKAATGISAEVRSQWDRIPPQVNVPMTVAVRRVTAVWLPDAESVRRRFPLLGDLSATVATGVALPLVVDGRAVGALELTWRNPVPLTEGRRRYLRALADVCARAIGRLARRDAAGPGARGAVGTTWVQPVFAALLNPAAILAPVRRDDAVVDFVYEYLNQPAEAFADDHGVELDRARLLSVYPDLGDRLLPALRQVLETGVAGQIDDLYVPASGGGPGYRCTFRAARLWDRILLTWRRSSDGDLLLDQLLAAERIARVGSFWWDVRTGEVRWSPQLSAVLGRAGERPPADMAELFDYIDARAVTKAMRERDPVTVTVHARGDRWLRLTAERLRDAGGTVTAVRGTVQDVTAERAAEARRARVEEALASQRQRMRVEEALADAFQQALLPTRGELPPVAGLDVHALCHVTPRSGRLPTSWYDLIPLAADETLLVVGEVFSQSPDSLVTAARLCNAIRGYAVLDMYPGQILDALDTMISRLFPDERATVALARFDRTRRTVWSASAGHSRPIRYRGAGPAQPCGPLGPPIGAAVPGGYRQEETEAEPGDVVLLHTDSLVVRRGGARHGRDALLAAAGVIELTDPRAILEHVNGKIGSVPDGDICMILGRVI